MPYCDCAVRMGHIRIFDSIRCVCSVGSRFRSSLFSSGPIPVKFTLATHWFCMWVETTPAARAAHSRLHT